MNNEYRISKYLESEWSKHKKANGLSTLNFIIHHSVFGVRYSEEMMNAEPSVLCERAEGNNE